MPERGRTPRLRVWNRDRFFWLGDYRRYPAVRSSQREAGEFLCLYQTFSGIIN